MKTLALLAAALAAVPASAEVHQCRSDKGVELGVLFEEAPGNRLAMDDGRKMTLLCGRGAALARCGWPGDGSFAYDGRLGKIHFVLESRMFGKPAVFRMQAPGETAWTDYVCRTADARVRRRFRRLD